MEQVKTANLNAMARLILVAITHKLGDRLESLSYLC